MEENVAVAQAEKCMDGGTDVGMIDTAAHAVDKTAWNATNSPLLRLPAELRQQIWSLYVKSTVINVDGPNRPGRRVYTDSYWNPFTKSWVYQDPPQPPYHLTFRTCGTLTNTVCHPIKPQTPQSPPPWDRCKLAHGVYHPLVSKQFWHETHDVFMRRATWIFHDHQDLVLFIATKKSVLPHVRRLVIYSASVYARPLGRWVDSWKQGLTWSKMRHFKRLEGVELHINIPFWTEMFGVLMHPSHDPLKCRSKLRAVLRSLQQHRLQPDLTTVKLYPVNISERFEKAVREKVEAWQDAWRDALLTHVPLGEGTSSNEKKWVRNHGREESSANCARDETCNA